MPSPLIIYGETFEEQFPTTVARVVTPNGTVLVQADLVTGTGSAGTGWDLYVYDLTNGTPTTAIYTDLGNAASDVLFNTLQTDGYWGGTDETGYDFRHTLDMTGAGLAIEGGHTYRCCYRLNTTLYGPIWVIAQVQAKGLLAT